VSLKQLLNVTGFAPSGKSEHILQEKAFFFGPGAMHKKHRFREKKLERF
jgi:hypothetical protein